MKRFKQWGLSLPEMLVALVSSCLLVTTLLKQYVVVKQHYKRSEKQLEQALDVQLVIDMMRDSIRQSGFTPCLGVEHLLTIDRRTDQYGLTALDLQSGDKPGFQVNHMRHQYGVIITQRGLTDLIVSTEAVLSLKHPVILADCYHAEVHRIQSMRSVSGGWDIGLDRPMFYTYEPPIYIGEWIESRFFMQAGSLFYGIGHPEMLSTAVHGLSASFNTVHGKRVVHVALALEKGRSIDLDTMARVM